MNSSKKNLLLLQYLRLSLAGAWLPSLEQINLLHPSNPASRFSTTATDPLLQKESLALGAWQELCRQKD